LILSDEDLNKSKIFQHDFIQQGYDAIDKDIYKNFTSLLIEDKQQC